MRDASCRQHARCGGRAREPLAGRGLPRRPQAQPYRGDEEREAIAMGKETSAKRVSAKQVAIDVLRAADEPLKAKEVAKRVIDSGRSSGLKGKNTGGDDLGDARRWLQARRSLQARRQGTYTLAETTSATGTPAAQAKPAAAKRRAQAREPAQAQTSKRRPTKLKPIRSR
jgi:hypothetical protein